MERLEIRSVQHADTDRLLPLMAAYWASDAIAGFEELTVRRQLREFLSTPSYGCAWLADIESIAVGYLVCTLVYSFEHGGLMAEVDELYVDAPWRGQGVARALMTAARAELHARTCVSLQSSGFGRRPAIGSGSLRCRMWAQATARPRRSKFMGIAWNGS